MGGGRSGTPKQQLSWLCNSCFPGAGRVFSPLLTMLYMLEIIIKLSMESFKHGRRIDHRYTYALLFLSLCSLMELVIGHV